jgi:hypothetical protein
MDDAGGLHWRGGPAGRSYSHDARPQPHRLNEQYDLGRSEMALIMRNLADAATYRRLIYLLSALALCRPGSSRW